MLEKERRRLEEDKDTEEILEMPHKMLRDLAEDKADLSEREACEKDKQLEIIEALDNAAIRNGCSCSIL